MMYLSYITVHICTGTEFVIKISHEPLQYKTMFKHFQPKITYFHCNNWHENYLILQTR